jgi:hypothetical protein
MVQFLLNFLTEVHSPIVFIDNFYTILELSLKIVEINPSVFHTEHIIENWCFTKNVRCVITYDTLTPLFYGGPLFNDV